MPRASEKSSGLSQNAYYALLITGMMITGTANTLAKRMQNDTYVINNAGEKVTFSYPWTQTLFMFLGEFSVILLYIYKLYTKQQPTQGQSFVPRTLTRNVQGNSPQGTKLRHSLLAEEDPEESVTQPSTSPLLFIIPTLFDVLGTSLGGIGLLYISPSVWQMFRGSIIIFSAILSNLFLDKKLEAFHWVGIVVVTVGLLIVGAAALLPNGDGDDDSGGDDDENANLLFGIIITVVGQACGAAQMVVEEKLLKGRGLMPSQVVGYEGMWGVLFMSFILLPVFYLVPGDDNSPHYENALDALHFIFTDSSLLWMAFVYTISISFYNFCGLSVAQHLSTVHRTLIDALRTTLVWGVDLFIYYVISENFGEVWDSNSWIQLGGFVLLFIGTIIYNKVVTLPCLQKQPAADLDYMAAEF